jgi:hypothetical protein
MLRVDVFHYQKVQVVVLIDVVGPNNIGVIQAAPLVLAVEAFERRGSGLGGRGLSRRPCAHELMFAQEHLAHAAGTEPFQHLVFAYCERLPFAKEKRSA